MSNLSVAPAYHAPSPSTPLEVLVPRWPAGPGVRSVCTTRSGGVSQAPWDALNLGDHVGDDPLAVAANRRLYAQHLGVRPVFLQQLHGRQRVELQLDTPDGTQADACHTRARGVACTIMVADCLPVLFADTRGGHVAAAHAGWRGLLGTGGQGVLESALEDLDPAHTLAWLGPCIGPQAFEVGPEVRQAFLVDQPELTGAFKPCQGDRWLADLPALARARLLRLGLTQVDGNDSSPHWCTVSRPALFFSHRRDAARLGSTGRMAACIWRL